MEIIQLITEERNQETVDIDRLDTVDMLKKINNEDKKVALAVEKEIPNIARAIDFIVERMQKGGRLIYIGAGTSGRLGIVDAVECPPTYGIDPGVVIGLIAGGDKAIKDAIEGAEDNAEAGKQDLININLNSKDSVVGITASGRTPYVIGALQYAKEIGALTVGISCNPNPSFEGIVDVMITPIVGPEVIMGSTRMKAGTAQKLVLNMLSTCAMIKLGKVYSNLMVDVKATNEKLINRARRIVKIATNADDELIEKKLKETNYNVKLTIVMLITGLNTDEGSKLLDLANGYVRRAIEIYRGRDMV